MLPSSSPAAATTTEPEAKDDGVLLYLAIKFKDHYKDQEEAKIRRLFRNDFNNNAAGGREAIRKYKRSVIKKVANENGDMVDIEVVVNKRKVTRKVIDEITGNVMEVETEVSTEDSEEDELNPDGTIKHKKKRRLRRGQTGGVQTEDEEQKVRRRRRRRYRGNEEADESSDHEKDTSRKSSALAPDTKRTKESGLLFANDTCDIIFLTTIVNWALRT